MRPPSSTAASRSATLTGRSASGVCASPSSFRAPSRRSRPVGVEGAHHVGGREPFALEQLPDQPRARQLARDVVLQVRVQAPVARVELGRGADRQHRGLEQVEAERLARRCCRRSSASETTVALRQPQRDLVGDVEPAERVAGVGVRARDALDRRHHAAVDEAEGDLRGTSGTDASPSATSSASRSIASPGLETVSGPLVGRAALLDDVRELVGDQAVAVRACSACTGRWRSRRRCRSRTLARTTAWLRSCAVWSVCTRTSERSPSVGESRSDTRRNRAPGRRRAWRRSSTGRSGWTSPLGMMPAPWRARDRAAERLVADVRDEARAAGAAASSTGSGGAPALAAARARGCARAHSQRRGYGRARAARKGRSSRPFGADVCSETCHARCHRKPAQSLDPGDPRRLAAPLDGAARRRDPARAVAQARARVRPSPPSCSAPRWR